MPTGASTTQNQENYWNTGNTDHQAAQSNAQYWSYMQQISSSQPNQTQQYVDSPWNQLGYSWSYLPSQTQQMHDQYQQQQQHQPHQNNYEMYQYNTYQNQLQQQQIGYNYAVPTQNFASNALQTPFANNNDVEPSQFQNNEYYAAPQHYTNSYGASARDPDTMQFQNQSESHGYHSSAFSVPTSQTSTVDAANNVKPSPVEDTFVPAPKEHKDMIEHQQQNVPLTDPHLPQQQAESCETASNADYNQWGNWGDDGDLDLDDSTVGMMYCRDDSDMQFNEPSVRNEPHRNQVAAPDLVATSQSAPDNQAAAEVDCQETDKRQRKPPDLFSGHEYNALRNGPDVVLSRFDAAQADELEDICLDAPHALQEAEQHQVGKGVSLAQTVSKWGQKLVNNLALEADKEARSDVSPQNLSAEAPTLSLAGIAYQQPAAQPRSRSSSTVSATSPKLGFSELLTYSYYEAEVKRPTIEQEEEEPPSKSAEVESTAEVSVSAEEQLPEADMAQLEKKRKYFEEATNQPQMDLPENESANSSVTVIYRANFEMNETKSSAVTGDDRDVLSNSTLPKTSSAAAEDEENWSMVENYDDRSKPDLQSASLTYNNSLSSWNQWEDEEDRESPENLETRGVSNIQAMSDWRPESERDEPAANNREENQDEHVDVEQWLHGQREAEGSEVVVELNHSRGFEITVNEPVNVPSAPAEEHHLQPDLLAQPHTDSKFDLDSGPTPDDRREKASMWSAMSNFDEKSVREMPTEDTDTAENKASAVGSVGSSNRTSPQPINESVGDALLIDRFLQDTHQIISGNSRKAPVMRRDDSSVWSTMANADGDSMSTPVVPSVRVSPVKDSPVPTSRKKVESLSSQGSSAISLSRKPVQNFTAAANKDIDNQQTDNSLVKKRRESLHKRYKEATKKSQEIFARLNVSLLNSTLDSSVVSKQSPLVIVASISEASSTVATPEPSPATQFSKSIKAKSTPVQNELPPEPKDEHRRREGEHEQRHDTGHERRKDTEQDHLAEREQRRDLDPDRRRDSDLERRRNSHSERERHFESEFKRRSNGRRPSSRASEQADWRHHSMNDEDEDYNESDPYSRNRRRPYSRASERDDWSRYQKVEDVRNRPHSTQGFDSEEESGDYEDDELRDYYRKFRHYQTGPYGRQRAAQYNWGLSQSRSFYAQQSMDPGWQKYLYDFYKVHGYYPTYEQLHQMWSEQHSTAAKIPPQKPLKVRVPKIGAGEKINESMAVTTALKRTEEYVADQRQQLFSDEKESEPSVSRADSDRSFDVPSSVSALDSYQVQVPYKHSVAHAVCRFGVGGHLTIVSGGNRASGQRQTVVEVRHIRNVIKNDAEIEENLEKMDSFGGPLLPLISDKSALIQFCQRKAEKYRHDLNVMDRDSGVLVWHLLICLIRQNGAIVGADLARLLMDGREFTDTNVVEVEKHAASRHHSNEDDDYFEEINAYDRSFVTSATQTTDRVEQHFRELLLGGSKKEALEWAIKYKLWGHALFLAMKIDQKTHTNVMIRFANSLALNDPLQTLYQMMSGVIPYASTQLPDDKWGDWRPHLAIILSNLSLLNGVPVDGQAFRVEMTSVLTLGNTLMDDGRTFAAQFCYLCCHLLGGWEIFSMHQRRQYVSLLGAHRELKEDEIFTMDRYQMTEIYEYAVGLLYAQTKRAFCLPTIQIYKLRYALHLAELGFAEDAYKYCGILASAIQQMPNLYNYALVSVVVDLATKLQRFDSTNEHFNFGYQQSQALFAQWILDLNLIAQGLKDGTIGPVLFQQDQQQQQVHGQVTEAYSSWQQKGETDGYEKSFYVGQPDDQPGNNVAPILLTEEPRRNSTKIDSRRNSMQHSNASKEVSFGRDSIEPDQSRRMSVVSTPRHSVGRERLSSVEDHVDSVDSFSVVAPLITYSSSDHHEHNDRTYAEVAAPPSIASAHTIGGHQTTMNQPSVSTGYQNETDYFGRLNYTTANQGAPSSENTPIKSFARTFNSTSTEGGGSSDNVFTPSPRQTDPVNKSRPTANEGQQRLKPEQKSEPKRNTSWIQRHIGGVLTKILPSQNEMILPDDKQKSIVWNEKTGRWMNMNGDDVDDTPPPPPPSLASSAANMKPTSSVTTVAQQEFVGAVNDALPSQAASVKPVNRFASQGKRYASINAFGGSAPYGTTAATASDGPPPLPGPPTASVIANQKNYFVPQAMNASSNDDFATSDPFSTVENNQPIAAGHQ